MIIWYALGSVIIVSLLSVLMILPFLSRKTIPKSVLVSLLSLSVGTLLGAVFLHLLPEALHEAGEMSVALLVIGGFLLFFLLEKLIHHHHHHTHKDIHGHAYHLAPLNLIGDGVHNFIDGLVIAGSYLVSIPVGIAATLAVVMHEIPQELGDVGVLLYAGLKKKKVLLFNFLSAAMAIIGAGIGLALGGSEMFHVFILPFAAGNFLYIAAANLVPELHRTCGIKETLLHLFFIILGVAIMVVLTIFLGH